MISSSEKLSVLEKILKNSEFAESKNYQELLRYLVQASIPGEPRKESAIAMTVFGKDLTKDMSDGTTVRVHVHNLRKKLDCYYLTEGKNDPIKLSIPKGHYLVQFTGSATANKKQKSHVVSLCFIFLCSPSSL